MPTTAYIIQLCKEVAGKEEKIHLNTISKKKMPVTEPTRTLYPLG